MRDVMNYRKKPVTVEAIQFLGWRNAAEIADWSGAFYVPRGYDHPMRHDSEYDRSNMHINEDAREAMKGIEYRDTDAFIDEIPQAYKPIDQVMDDAKDLVKIRHTFHQVLNVKGD